MILLQREAINLRSRDEKGINLATQVGILGDSVLSKNMKEFFFIYHIMKTPFHLIPNLNNGLENPDDYFSHLRWVHILHILIYNRGQSLSKIGLQSSRMSGPKGCKYEHGFE